MDSNNPFFYTLTMTTTTALTPFDVPDVAPQSLAELGRIADAVTQASIFSDYVSSIKPNTRTAKLNDLHHFARFLSAAGLPYSAEQLLLEPYAWTGITYGTVAQFKKAMYQRGDAVSSINRRLSTIKHHVTLALSAGVVSADDERLIRTVKGYQTGVVDLRAVDRVGHKKAEPTRVPAAVVNDMLSPAETPQGCRDRLLIALLFVHGMRVSEVAQLAAERVDIETGRFDFDRPKVARIARVAVGRHHMTTISLAAFRSYAPYMPDSGPILRGSIKSQHGRLTNRPMSVSAIKQRVRALGKKHGVEQLSPHDGRHYAATLFAELTPDVNKMMLWFGWTNADRAIRYINQAEYASFPDQ